MTFPGTLRLLFHCVVWNILERASMGLTNWEFAGITWGREKGHKTYISKKFPLHNTPQLKCNTTCHSHEYEDALPRKTRASFSLKFLPSGVSRDAADGQLTLQPPGPPLCWFGWGDAAQDMQVWRPHTCSWQWNCMTSSKSKGNEFRQSLGMEKVMGIAGELLKTHKAAGNRGWD